MRRSSLHVISVIRWQWVLVLHREAKVVLASDSDSLVSKSRYTKSAVWIYFGFEADEEGRPKIQDAVVCRMCKISVSAKGGNTLNLLLHLKVHHPQWHLEVKKANSKPSGKDKDHAKTGKASSRHPSCLTHFDQATSMNERAESGSSWLMRWHTAWLKIWCQFILSRRRVCLFTPSSGFSVWVAKP